MKIFYTNKFKREYKKLTNDIKDKSELREKIFRKNPFDKKLKTHKLSGELGDFWSYSVDLKYRIIFEFGKNEVIYFHSIGTYNIYK